jgi:hypothetical protein
MKHFLEENQMSTFNQQCANDAREALHRLADGTRRVEDPADIHAVIGALTDGLASLAQSLHQLAAFHDGPARQAARVPGEARAARSASYQVAWELHRAAELTAQVATGIDRAREVEATIAYDVHPVPTLAPVQRPSRVPGVSL